MAGAFMWLVESWVMWNLLEPRNRQGVHLFIPNTKSTVGAAGDPTTSEGLIALRKKIDEILARGGELDRLSILQIQSLGNAAENVFADRAILLDENLLFFEQNNKRNTRKSIKATAVSSAKVMSYKDIVEAQKQRDIKEANTGPVPGRGRGRPKRKSPAQVLGKRSRSKEVEVAEHKIKSLGLEEYCSVLRF
jgi:hypothetical protein